MIETRKPVWLITGCSTGLGAALASRVLQSGHRVVATARAPTKLSYLPDTDDVLKLPLDVTSKGSVAVAFNSAIAKFQRVDYVVNNAGYGIFAEAEGTSDAEARDIFETNFWGSANVAIEAVKIFRDQNPTGAGAMLIQISSMLGRAAGAGQTFYSSSKYAIEGFIEALSKELLPSWNIKVLIAEPGAIGGTAFNRNILQTRGILPAYRDLDCPTGRIREWLASPDLEDEFPPAKALAATLFEVVGKPDLPLRLPLGKDSWGAIFEEESRSIRDLNEWRPTSILPNSECAWDEMNRG